MLSSQCFLPFIILRKKRQQKAGITISQNLEQSGTIWNFRGIHMICADHATVGKDHECAPHAPSLVGDGRDGCTASGRASVPEKQENLRRRRLTPQRAHASLWCARAGPRAAHNSAKTTAQVRAPLAPHARARSPHPAPARPRPSSPRRLTPMLSTRPRSLYGTFGTRRIF